MLASFRGASTVGVFRLSLGGCCLAFGRSGGGLQPPAERLLVGSFVFLGTEVEWLWRRVSAVCGVGMSFFGVFWFWVSGGCGGPLL